MPFQGSIRVFSELRFQEPRAVPTQQTSAEVAPEEAVRQLQTMLPAAPKAAPEPLLLENVSPGLLLPPVSAGLVDPLLCCIIRS